MDLMSNQPADSMPNLLTNFQASLERIKQKIMHIQKATDSMRQDRIALETKIEDAQKRIQHILSRLPDQGDTRQLNLLSDSANSPSTPKIDNDDHEPTTH
jgi:predicted  nucleic acid-binding Zn-ribbon protein